VLESSSKKTQMTQYYMSNPQHLIGHSNKRSPREGVTYSENTAKHAKNGMIARRAKAVEQIK